MFINWIINMLLGVTLVSCKIERSKKVAVTITACGKSEKGTKRA